MLKRKNMKILLSMLAMAVLPAFAVECVWTGAGDGKFWSDAANWQDSRKPSNGDSVVANVGAITMANDIGELSLASLTINATGDFNFGDKNLSSAALTLNGDSSITSTTLINNYTAMTLGSGVKFNFQAETGSIWNADLSGSGDFYKRGKGSLTIQNCSNANFSGDWYFRQGTVSVYAILDAFGSGEINIYGQDKSKREPDETSGAALAFRRDKVGGQTIRVTNRINCFYHTSINSYRGIVIDGDIFYSSYASDEQLRLGPVVETASTGITYYGYFDIYGSIKQNPDAHAGKICLYSPNINCYIRLAGPEVDLVDQVFDAGSAGVFYFGSKIKTTNTSGYLIYGTYERTYVFEKEDVMPHTCLWQLGHTKQNSKFKIDLNGYNQYIGSIQFGYPADPEVSTVEGEITSERAPATLTLRDARPTSNRYYCSINGQASIMFDHDPAVPERAGTHVFYFTNTCNTTGSIGVRDRTIVYLLGEMPSLSSIELADRGSIVMTENLLQKDWSNTTLNIHDLRPRQEDASGWRTNGYFHAGDLNRTYLFKRVMFNDVEQPTGLYHRQKAGSTAIYAAPVWMQSGTGLIKIEDHNQRWVWTGNGDGESINDAENWACNTVPNLSNGNTILDFKYAKGAKNFEINSDWNLAGLECETNSAVYTFGGNGTVKFSGDEKCAINAKFTDSLAVTYAGTARQIVGGAVSDTSGQISVLSGVLELAPSGGLSGAADMMISEGAKLALAKDVTAVVNTLKLDNQPARRGIWGTELSGATRFNDAFFEGLGKLTVQHTGTGVILFVR